MERATAASDDHALLDVAAGHEVAAGIIEGGATYPNEPVVLSPRIAEA